MRFILFLSILFFLSCSDKKPADKKPRFFGENSWEFAANIKDTINRTVNGVRQGHWIIFKFIAASQTVQSVYSGDTTVYKTIRNQRDRVKTEEGNYVDGKKEGEWKKFSPGGKLIETKYYKKDSLVK